MVRGEDLLRREQREEKNIAAQHHCNINVYFFESCKPFFGVFSRKTRGAKGEIHDETMRLQKAQILNIKAALCAS